MDDEFTAAKRKIEIYDGNRSKRSKENFTIKFLLSDQQAGNVIGRNGSNIQQLQEEHHTVINISPSQSHFPGSHERVGKISGVFENVRECLSSVFEIMIREKKDTSNLVLLIIPEAACGVILGKKGQRIRDIVSLSGANIKILTDEAIQGLNERKLSIQGDLPQEIVAARRVLDYMSESSNYFTYDLPGVEYPESLNDKVPQITTHKRRYENNSPENHYMGNPPPYNDQFPYGESYRPTPFYQPQLPATPLTTMKTAQLILDPGITPDIIAYVIKYSGSQLDFPRDEKPLMNGDRLVYITGNTLSVDLAFCMLSRRIKLKEPPQNPYPHEHGRNSSPIRY